MAENKVCGVDPGTFAMLRTVGWLFVLAALISLSTGKAYYRRVYVRDAYPSRYWQTVVSYLVLAAFIFAGLYIC
jgi:uncharacterized membrane protein